MTRRQYITHNAYGGASDASGSFSFDQSAWDQTWHMIAQQDSQHDSQQNSQQQQQVPVERPFQTDVWPAFAAAHPDPYGILGGALDTVVNQLPDQHAGSDAYELSPSAVAASGGEQVPRSLDSRMICPRAVQASLDDIGDIAVGRLFLASPRRSVDLR